MVNKELTRGYLLVFNHFLVRRRFWSRTHQSCSFAATEIAILKLLRVVKKKMHFKSLFSNVIRLCGIKKVLYLKSNSFKRAFTACLLCCDKQSSRHIAKRVTRRSPMSESQWKLKISAPSLTIFVILGNRTLKYLDVYLEHWDRDNVNLLRLLNGE